MTTNVVGSKMPDQASESLKLSKAGYGQNGFGGASSDLPNEATTAGLLPQADLAGAKVARKKIQERPISDQLMPTSFGMDSRSPRNK